jgi:hypothetical protein
LSANVGNQAFFLGIRWGIGHSTGLLLVGVLLIAFSSAAAESDDEDAAIDVPDALSKCFESLVGVFMIALGAYGLRRAWDKKPSRYGSILSGPASMEEELHRVHRSESDGVEITAGQPSYHDDLVETPDLAETPWDEQQEQSDEIESSAASWIQLCARRVSAGTLSLAAGIVHGLAGPGGVLGVIPAVQLRDGRLAVIYLGSFCLSSTLTMGVFATLYGTCSSRLGQKQGTRREFLIECLSACLSVLVGVTWLTLLYFNKLEDVFP